MNSTSARTLAAAAVFAALGLFTAPAFAGGEKRGSEIPTNAYHDATLTPDERGAIAEEENVSPNDGRASVPPREARGIVPDANAPADAKQQDILPAPRKRTAESEADVIIDQSKKNDRVTHKDLDECISQWDPQSQMSKSEWAESCRTTLEYFPEGQN